MKSLKDLKCGSIIPNVDIKKGKNFQFFGEITIEASPPIYPKVEFITLRNQINQIH